MSVKLFVKTTTRKNMPPVFFRMTTKKTDASLCFLSKTEEEEHLRLNEDTNPEKNIIFLTKTLMP